MTQRNKNSESQTIGELKGRLDSLLINFGDHRSETRQQYNDLRAALEKGFEKQADTISKQDKRISSLEGWKKYILGGWAVIVAIIAALIAWFKK